MTPTIRLIALLVSVAAAQAAAQTSPIATWRASHERPILDELLRLVAIPNVAGRDAEMRRNADHLAALFEKRGFTVERTDGAGSPVVFASLDVPSPRGTIVLYIHYDGQPVDPTEWTRCKPFAPCVYGPTGEVTLGPDTPIDPEWRVYGRSASDDKGPIVGILAALDALEALGRRPSVNVALFLEGEEEAGSPHLEAFLQKYRGEIAGDGWLLCDGPVHQSRRMQIYFGARGITDVEVTLYGPARPLHSGHYGNWAPNPALELAHLVAGLRDVDGRIQVAGFYDDVRPPTPSEQEALREVPDVDAALRGELALARTEAGGAPLVERILLPALNVRGLSSGGVGSLAANAIPTEARASIDFRLVPDQTPARVREKVEAHLRGLGYEVVHDAVTLEARRTRPRLVRLEWGPGYPAARTSMDLPFSRALTRAVEEASGAPLVRLPTLGGSVGMELFARILDRPVVGLPIVNHDNNQHAADENLRLQNLWDGIEVYAAVMTRVGALWDAK